MANGTELIVMLTHDDYTAKNASAIFEQCRYSKAKLWGLKEKGIPLEQMKCLYAHMKEYGKTIVLEVVAYTEKECIEGAKMAVECGCDILMGTTFFDSVNELCKKNNLKYVPFVGEVTGRPSLLEGNIDDMIDEAIKIIEKGVYGIDLLGYRYTGNAALLIQKFVSRVNAPICIAGNIDSFKKLDEVKSSGAWAFTIGGAFFENKFGEDFNGQIEKVYEYVSQNV